MLWCEATSAKEKVLEIIHLLMAVSARSIVNAGSNAALAFRFGFESVPFLGLLGDLSESVFFAGMGYGTAQ